jgi:hypothetical protein
MIRVFKEGWNTRRVRNAGTKVNRDCPKNFHHLGCKNFHRGTSTTYGIYTEFRLDNLVEQAK